MKMPKARKRHIVEVYLEYVDIRYSRRYLAGLLSGNPFPDTFAGIKEILAAYHIFSRGISLSVSELAEFNDPFITVISDPESELVLVTGISSDKCTYLTEDNSKCEIGLNNLEAVWNGKVLFPEVTELSGEHDYIRNSILSAADKLKHPLIVVLATCIILTLFVSATHENTIYSSILAILYCSGIAVSVMLIMKGLNVYNPFIHKICHSGGKTNCSAVMESKGSKLFGLIGWSEIGFIYFSGNLLFFLLFPQYINILFLVNILSLPYSLWSVGYQRFVTKRWCPLCISVQIIFWLQFGVFILYGTTLNFGKVPWHIFVYYILTLSIPSVLLWVFMPIKSKSLEAATLKRSLLKLKSDESVFKTLLANSTECDLPEEARSIVLGNISAENTLTVLSNPYCGFCATFHGRLVKFLDSHPQFKAELVFVGEEPMEKVILFLIGVYFNYDHKMAERIYEKWFESHEKIIGDYRIDGTNEKIGIIYNASKVWYDTHRGKGTPTIYINNRLLPEGYILEDLGFVF